VKRSLHGIKLRRLDSPMDRAIYRDLLSSDLTCLASGDGDDDVSVKPYGYDTIWFDNFLTTYISGYTGPVIPIMVGGDEI
jgi:hypothetical protein